MTIPIGMGSSAPSRSRRDEYLDFWRRMDRSEQEQEVAALRRGQLRYLGFREAAIAMICRMENRSYLLAITA